MKTLPVKYLCALVVINFFAFGCSSPNLVEPKYIEEIRPVAPTHKVISYTIQRNDLRDALTRLRESPIRLVPVFQSVTSTESYEYRVFDIDSNGVYGLLGLENSDIIVAANRYLIRDPKQFPVFVQLLETVDQANIEIRRDGEARLLKYSFVPSIGSSR